MSTLLSINNYHYRRDGADATFLDHNIGLDRTGWSVVPFAMQHPRNLESEASLYFVSDIEFGQRYTLSEKLTRATRVIYSLEARRNLQLLLRRYPVDIAHCHNIYHHLSPSVLHLLAQYQIPTVMTLHDLKILCPAYHMHRPEKGICEKCVRGKFVNVLSNRCIKSSAALSALVMIESSLHHWLDSYEKYVSSFIATSQFYIEKFVQHGWSRSRFQLIRSPIDTSRFVPHPEPGNAILYFGSLSAEKGLGTLIRAAALAQVPVRIAGDGPEADKLKAEARRIGAPVEFLGDLNETALHSEITRCRATVIPSEWYESAPYAVLQSFAMGKPAIASNIGGLPEMVIPLTNGLLFDPGSSSMLAERLVEIATLPDADVAALGQSARQFVEKHHSLSQYTEQIQALYSTLASSIPGREIGP